MANGDLQALFWKVVLYYGILFLSLATLIGVSQPQWLVYLPVGGLEGLSRISTLLGEGDFSGQLPSAGQSEQFFDGACNLFSDLISSLIVMIPLRWVYMSNRRQKKPFDPEVASGLLLIPLVVTAVVFCVKFSLALAFVLVGILAGVRIRTELKNKTDFHFTFASIALGLAVGAGYLSVAVVLAFFFALTVLYVTPGFQDDVTER
jgi:hypothetical protein